ncbi:hypothetical protein BN7_5497 [Wickerhamomyces ciferrii]|uniref:Zn(2)-C6 fungal-type domain-containing protein n=1 Tax=Wickerhamomyces ciferrii (strain ATCC 14091 / BCRC 22168 / CBS 111 / JCM 3599 / NBRC 0793 / NRRL Y-1031 F-60-10) TaxID=1206466 RepID=K0KL04_WICCF|nr:uncharacterized protein BN7_5497 [Wickerhamomyces ciferrii]CCH45910.1 hypothetical protein BN7_5497 [Wickerhamomyces ciferrii]
MKLNPHEHLIKFESLGRKRKKKCDEKKPICSTCSSKDLECIWPKDSKDKLPSNFQIPKSHKHSKFVSEVKLSENENDYPLTKGEQSYLSGKGEKSGTIYPIFDENETRALFEDLEESPDSNYSLDIENRPEYRTGFQVDFISHFTYDPEQKFLFACANGFIQAIGPQYTHPSLTTSATVTPWIDKNPIMRMIASACGCSFLSWESPELIPLSTEKYHIAMNALGSYLLADQPDCSSNWVGAALQLMCLCAKVTNIFPKSAVLNLSQSYKIIKSRFISFESNYQNVADIFSDISTTTHETEYLNAYLKDFESDYLLMDIRNSELDKYGLHDFDTNFERMFLESFVYNYSVAILLSESHKYLPNPFEVFNNLRKALRTPLYNCDVAWMNNPVSGASLDSFELVSKASYLIKKLHDPLMFQTAKKLYDIACFYTSPVIPSNIGVGSRKYKDLRESVLMSEIVAKSAKLILRKLISMEIKVDDCELQKDLNSILEKFKLITPNSKVNGIALQIAWGTSPECIEIKTRGLDILLDKRVMCKVLL